MIDPVSLHLLHGIFIKAKAIYAKVKTAQSVADWAQQHAQLLDLERTYQALLDVPMEQREPRYDLRTTASGGPTFRKGIKDMAAACDKKDLDMFKLAFKSITHLHHEFATE
jgi:hypothetical protein